MNIDRTECDLNVDPMATHPARRKARFPRRGIPRLRSCPCAAKARRTALYRTETERERADREFWERYYEGYAKLKADPVAWNEVLREREAFDPALVHTSDWL